MIKPGQNPQGKTPAGQNPGGKAAAGRRRVIATSIGVSALLALGGVVWAAGLPVAARTGGVQGGGQADAATTAPASASAAAPPTTPDPATAEAPAPAQAPEVPAPQPAPAVADPAPVDRKGKSEEELATIPQPVAAAVDLKSKKNVKSGVSATITEMTAVQGEAEGVGEVAGPAVRFKITVRNDTAAALALDRAVVDVAYGDDAAPAGQLSGPDPLAFPASVAPGESGVGVFIFAVPLEARDKVRIHFNLEAETPIATFAGSAPA